MYGDEWCEHHESMDPALFKIGWGVKGVRNRVGNALKKQQTSLALPQQFRLVVVVVGVSVLVPLFTKPEIPQV